MTHVEQAVGILKVSEPDSHCVITMDPPIEDCGALLLEEAKEFLAYLTAVPLRLSWDTTSDEFDLKDRFIDALSQGKLTMAMAIEISKILAAVTAVEYYRGFP